MAEQINSQTDLLKLLARKTDWFTQADKSNNSDESDGYLIKGEFTTFLKENGVNILDKKTADIIDDFWKTFDKNEGVDPTSKISGSNLFNANALDNNEKTNLNNEIAKYGVLYEFLTSDTYLNKFNEIKGDLGTHVQDWQSEIESKLAEHLRTHSTNPDFATCFADHEPRVTKKWQVEAYLDALKATVTMSDADWAELEKEIEQDLISGESIESIKSSITDYIQKGEYTRTDESGNKDGTSTNTQRQKTIFEERVNDVLTNYLRAYEKNNNLRMSNLDPQLYREAVAEFAYQFVTTSTSDSIATYNDYTDAYLATTLIAAFRDSNILIKTAFKNLNRNSYLYEYISKMTSGEITYRDNSVSHSRKNINLGQTVAEYLISDKVNEELINDIIEGYVNVEKSFDINKLAEYVAYHLDACLDNEWELGTFGHDFFQNGYPDDMTAEELVELVQIQSGLVIDTTGSDAKVELREGVTANRKDITNSMLNYLDAVKDNYENFDMIIKNLNGGSDDYEKFLNKDTIDEVIEAFTSILDKFKNLEAVDEVNEYFDNCKGLFPDKHTTALDNAYKYLIAKYTNSESEADKAYGEELQRLFNLKQYDEIMENLVIESDVDTIESLITYYDYTVFPNTMVLDWGALYKEVNLYTNSSDGKTEYTTTLNPRYPNGITIDGSLSYNITATNCDATLNGYDLTVKPKADSGSLGYVEIQLLVDGVAIGAPRKITVNIDQINTIRDDSPINSWSGISWSSNDSDWGDDGKGVDASVKNSATSRVNSFIDEIVAQLTKDGGYEASTLSKVAEITKDFYKSWISGISDRDYIPSGWRGKDSDVENGFDGNSVTFTYTGVDGNKVTDYGCPLQIRRGKKSKMFSNSSINYSYTFYLLEDNTGSNQFYIAFNKANIVAKFKEFYKLYNPSA